MKKISLIIAYMAIFIVTAFFQSEAIETVSAQSCSAELFTSFYPAAFVEQTLETYKVPKYNRQWILRDLANKDQDVLRLFEQKARLLRPKPLILDQQTLMNPENRQLIVSTFESSLSDVFTQVMRKYAITDSKQIQGMFTDIQNQKALRFDQCVSAGHIQAPVGYPQTGLTPQTPSDNLTPVKTDLN